MVHFRLPFLGVAALLFRIVLAAPTPVNTGDIVNIAPADTIGGHRDTPGAAREHPHIVLGHENGNAVLAPVTHNNDPLDGPRMGEKAKGIHPKLEGNILVHHVTADPNKLSQSGQFRGKTVDADKIEQIKEAKRNAAEELHGDAQMAHKKAAKAHKRAAKAHEKIAQKYGGGSIVDEHLNKVAEHRQLAKDHKDQAAIHGQDAKSGKPVTYDEYANTRKSIDGARNSHQAAGESKDQVKAEKAHLRAADAHEAAAARFAEHGDKRTAAYHTNEAEKHVMVKANKHRPSSTSPPDVDQSIKDAKQSRKAAKQAKPEKKAKNH